jgi:hypothetical protein
VLLCHTSQMAVRGKRKSRDICEPDQTDILRNTSTSQKKLKELDKDFSNEEGTLCRRCSEIDLDEAFRLNLTTLEAWSKEGQFVYSLGQLDNISAATKCSLCRFWGEMRLPLDPRKRTINQDPKGLHYTLRAFPASKIWLGLKGKPEGVNDSALLAVMPSDSTKNSPIRVPWRCWNAVGKSSFVYSASLAETDATDRIAGRVVEPSTVDFMSIRRWMTFCKEHHSRDCVPVKTINLPGFRMIDCLTLEVVPTPRGCEYVALSYVWGKPKQQEDPAGNQLSVAPAVVSDAIKVTTSLGFRYLWVDRYCIDQENKEEKHAQFRKMDVIYGGAQITIIAATGQDSTDGLPGVGSRPRSRPLSVKVGSHVLSTTFPSPKREIGLSKWSTRAWTYQEGLLSRRRLAFTGSQVYFQCTHMYCPESLISPLGLLRSPLCEDHMNQLGVAFPSGGVGTDENDMEWRIREYNKRSLSYPSDAFNAILGILSAFETKQDPIFHLWGIPIRKGMYFQRHNPPELAWVYALCQGLRWYTSMSAKRRNGFPSFSWVGWEIGRARLSMSSSPTIRISRSWTCTNQFKIIPVSIELELKDGALVTWDSLRNSNQISEATSKTCFLLVHSWSFSCSVNSLSSLIIHANDLGLHENAYSGTPRNLFYYHTLKEKATALTKESSPSDIYRAIIMDCVSWQTNEGEFGVELNCLIVQRHSSWYERVGFAVIDFGNLSHQMEVHEDGTGIVGGIVLKKDEFRLG